ncbi:hypothetical protein AVEN_141936-1 [Araneus ventricosus]|uniref:Uncharacterized protein n=1 Tax=Araneus ventricosus TaxID=182803 RepID=A0A4Y2TJ42_ARAVE|nr:hypothetical protein AVEN_141936-1 [Araneus ventricosus]
MIAFIQISRVFASSPREPRRNLSAATKHGDLTDKTPSACKNNILSRSPSPSHPKRLSFILERGVRIGTGSRIPAATLTSSCSAPATIPLDPYGLPPTQPLPPTTAADHLIPRTEIIQPHQLTITGDKAAFGDLKNYLLHSFIQFLQQ